MSKILVTGASGFIGTALVSRLKSLGHIIIGTGQGEVRSPDYFNDYQDESITHVYHLAARTFVPASWEMPEDFYSVNIMGTLNVLEFCRKNNISLTLVSAYIYGKQKEMPISESSAVEPNNPYAISKYMAETACHEYAREFDLSVTIVRPFNIYGINQPEHFLLPTIIKQAMDDEQIEVMDLVPKRDYLYLEDLVDALVMTMGHKGVHVYNAGSGVSYSVAEIIASVQSVLGTEKQVVSKKVERVSEVLDVVADISLIQNKLGWSPKTSFKQGIEYIVNERRGYRS